MKKLYNVFTIIGGLLLTTVLYFLMDKDMNSLRK